MFHSYSCMLTAEDMYKYCQNYDMGIGFFKSWSVKHFRLIEDELKPDESVLTVFVGLVDRYNHSFAITIDRIIMAKQAVFGSSVKSVSIMNINDTSLRKDLLHKFRMLLKQYPLFIK